MRTTMYLALAAVGLYEHLQWFRRILFGSEERKENHMVNNEISRSHVLIVLMCGHHTVEAAVNSRAKSRQ
jgi:hypothetical protein